MGKGNLTVVGIMVNNRSDSAPEVQEAITRHGSDVICRMGVPTQNKEDGLITLIMDGPQTSIEGLINDLKAINEVDVQAMTF